jgi:ribosomal protein S18 acetylase RimI-like enzyme
MAEKPSDRVLYRPARKDDCRTIAMLFSMSSDGVADYIWTGLAEPGEDIMDVGRRRYESQDSVFSYRNCVVAEIDVKIAGMLVAFPMPEPDNHDEETETDPVLAPYGKLEQYNSYYICGMAAFPEYRGMGIGTKFLEIAEKKAKELNLPQLSLIVFEGNEGAKKLYERQGFREIAREPIVPHELIRHTGYALLMVKNLD